MKKFTISIFIILLTYIYVNGQGFRFIQQVDKSYCATPPIEESVWKADPTFLNDSLKIRILRDHGFEVPWDYFGKVDERGRYNGKVILKITILIKSTFINYPPERRLLNVMVMSIVK